MMGYGYADPGLTWGLLIAIGVLVLVLVSGIAALSAWRRRMRVPRSLPSPGDPGQDGISRARAILEQRYVAGELSTDDYLDRLHTLSRSR